MLFNSFEFIFLFLPVCIVGFFLIAKVSKQVAAAWLFLASLFFYAWWDWHYLWLLLGSIVFHFLVGQWLLKLAPRPKQCVLITAIVIDVLLLVYFKYADMFIGSINNLSGSEIALLKIVLPLGISFFTFTQIAFLVDTYENKVLETRPVFFGLFVTYFPHLIAGPVLHHKEMMPQFASDRTYKPQWGLIAVGIGIFTIGLAKKVLIADNLSSYANSFFSNPQGLGLFQTWQGVLAYTFQLYFDFSGYSDMAVGLSLMFGIKLPINFYSPYKATNISDFWRRWHMTLSRFLRDYLYIRLGGNRHGKFRRYFNLLTTMFLGGLWHGAGWNFAIWGLMHGLYLCIHEAWKVASRRFSRKSEICNVAAVAITFLAVAFAWVPFRASDLTATTGIWTAMFGLNGVTLPEVFFSRFSFLSHGFASLGITQEIGGGSKFVFGYLWIVVAAILVFCTPNTYEIYRRFRPAIYDEAVTAHLISNHAFSARFNKRTAVMLAVLFIGCLLFLGRPSEFLYFQF
jgi:alginate O-acetyltransferase complex protein AlgI